MTTSSQAAPASQGAQGLDRDEAAEPANRAPLEHPLPRTALLLLRGGTITLAAYGYWLREKGWITPRHMRVMRLDNSVAYAVTGLSGNQGYLQRLAVHPDHRRSGLGRALAITALGGDLPHPHPRQRRCREPLRLSGPP